MHLTQPNSTTGGALRQFSTKFGIPSEKRKQRTFIGAYNDEGVHPYFLVEQINGPKIRYHKALFDLGENFIKIDTHGETVDDSFSVKPVWNEKERTCKLHLKDDEDRPYEVWEISYMALSKLFFE